MYICGILLCKPKTKTLVFFLFFLVFLGQELAEWIVRCGLRQWKDELSSADLRRVRLECVCGIYLPIYPSTLALGFRSVVLWRNPTKMNVYENVWVATPRRRVSWCHAPTVSDAPMAGRLKDSRKWLFLYFSFVMYILIYFRYNLYCLFLHPCDYVSLVGVFFFFLRQ